ncbi:tetratricopeptide repeat protein [Psychrobacter sp. 16-MNA-CIBAN-0192]|uniref:tetratricopeptide repeat protein n=1 Tax=Psychrobacter sp. 16-MNA-CIBAN-0192 TaxID=3140448 RepID=UPI00331B113C
MALHRQVVVIKQKRTLRSTIMTPFCIVSLLALSACETVPIHTSSAQKPSTPASQMPAISDDDYVNEVEYYPVEPYVIPKMEQAPDIIPNTGVNKPPARDTHPLPPTQPPIPPSHNELLKQARQHSQQQSRTATSDNSHLPAVQSLMQAGISQLKSGQLSAAETSFTQAQRLAPKSSAVYFYLAQVALEKDQPRKAEAMARRGLSVTKDTGNRRALWQVILRSAQQQNNARVIKEAQQALR